MKILLLLSLVYLSLLAKDISYTKRHIHAFLPHNNELTISTGLELVNDTIDVLNIKEQEFGSSRSDLDTLGDMVGFDFNLGYAFYT